MDFQIGDNVRAEVNGKEYRGPLAKSGEYWTIETGEERYLFYPWQLTRVEEPESKWLLPVDEVNTLQSCVGCTRKERLAQLRHVAERLGRQNKISEFLQPSISALFLYPDDWAELQKEAGL